MSHLHRIRLIALFLLPLFLLACSATEDVIDDLDDERRATAQIAPLGGGDVEGTVTFTQMGDRVHVSADITGLSPGLHGFHVHEGTSCVEPGGHYNPAGSPHSSPNRSATMRHVGDLGNLVADESGRALYSSHDHVLTLSGTQSIVGRVVIVHAGRDEIIPQPSGDAGMMIACGAITLVDM